MAMITRHYDAAILRLDTAKRPGEAGLTRNDKHNQPPAIAIQRLANTIPIMVVMTVRADDDEELAGATTVQWAK